MNGQQKSVFSRGLVACMAAMLGIYASISMGFTKPLAQMPVETLTIITSSGQHQFEVEVARSSEEHARGLMGRRHLPAHQGMIFDYPALEPVSMWMENTHISLDMLFVDHERKIIQIVHRTQPMSRRIIPSGGPVRAVIELNAGTAERIGAAVGDQIEIPFLKAE